MAASPMAHTGATSAGCWVGGQRQGRGSTWKPGHEGPSWQACWDLLGPGMPWVSWLRGLVAVPVEAVCACHLGRVP